MCELCLSLLVSICQSIYSSERTNDIDFWSLEGIVHLPVLSSYLGRCIHLVLRQYRSVNVSRIDDIIVILCFIGTFAPVLFSSLLFVLEL